MPFNLDCCCCSVAKSCNSLPLRGLQNIMAPLSSILPKFAQIHVYWVGNAIQPSYSLLPPSPFAFSLSQHQDFFLWVGSFPMSSSSHSWPKYWSFSFSISPSNEYLGLISFRIDWLDLLAFQGTLESSPTQFKVINSQALGYILNMTVPLAVVVGSI